MGCGTGPDRHDPTDAGTDADTDSDTDSDSGTGSDTDTGSDTGSDTGTGSDPEFCLDDAEMPPASDAGATCVEDADCELGFLCIPEVNGWPDGYCIAAGIEGADACDPALPASCPRGSTCVYAGLTGGGDAVYYCMKSCILSETNPWDSSSCGCREGYACHLTSQICYPGCRPETEEQDCCTYWADDDGDWIDDGAAEDRDVPGCTATCAPDAFRCVHAGDDGAEFGEGCTLDQDCPANGTCLQERDADGFDGAGADPHIYVGGYCIRHGCQLAGRECGDDCRLVPRVTSWRRTQSEATWTCVGTCRVAPDGADPYAHNPECRGGYGCQPLLASLGEAQDGYCWNGEFLTADRVNNAGAACEWDYDCYSPFGQGWCIEETTVWTEGMCVIQACDFAGMDAYCAEADDKICEPQEEGELSLCFERCDDPGGGSGPAHGCSRDEYACYASARGDGSGACLPACQFNSDCVNLFEREAGEIECDVGTGLCVDP